MDLNGSREAFKAESLQKKWYAVVMGASCTLTLEFLTLNVGCKTPGKL